MKTEILLPQTVYVNPGDGSAYNVTGNSYPASSYYLGNGNLQTLNLSLTNLVGTVSVEATLASTPTDSDWFEVYSVTANVWDITNSTHVNNANLVTYVNVPGNFVYSRATINNFQNGIVNYVRMSY